ncbi:MAG: hypothetical protein HGA71_12005 [Azonexaceae bacterium]|nr:hypothetical protein [Azonexaceae bacterium]
MMEKFELPQFAGESCCPNIGEVLSSVITYIDRQQQSGSRELPLTGVSTGFPEIDRLTLGLQAGELVVIAGRPGSGRYALALKVVEHIAGTLGQPVVFHSLTNTAEEVGLRLLSSTSGVDSYRMRTGQLDESEWQKISTGLATMHSAPLAIESNPRGDFESCIERTRQHTKHFGRPPGLIVVDDFHAFRFAAPPPTLDEARQVALCSLRQLAGELAAPLLILSQLDARIDRRPDLNPCLIDLPRSGCIEAKADTILLLSRDYEFEDDQTKGTPRRYGIRIHEAKSRFDYWGQCRITLSEDALPTSLFWGACSA